MKLSNIISLAVSLLFVPLADRFLVRAELEQTPPEKALLRFYDLENCVVNYHTTGVKDFQRAECVSNLKPDSCVTGKFRSYRLEGITGNEAIPKLDEWLVKYNATDCDFGPGKFTAFKPHPFVNPPFLMPGCHNFVDAKELGINPDFVNSYKCSWATYSKQP